jgi:ABC-type phosphate transport system substrate-binding protein
MDDALNNEFMENTIDFGFEDSPKKSQKKQKRKQTLIGGLKLKK